MKNKINLLAYFSFSLLVATPMLAMSNECDKNLLSLCEGTYKSNEYLYFCTDINKKYLVKYCDKPDSVIKKETQAIFSICEKDYGKYCVKSTDRHPKEGVACIKEYKNRVSGNCKRKIEKLFKYVN